MEAASTFGWATWADDSIGIDRFGASAPGELVLEKLGINVDNVVARARTLVVPTEAKSKDESHRNGAVMTERLKELYDEQGQSPWLDNLRRGYLTSGELATLRDRGVRGLTSNPSIFQKAIQGRATTTSSSASWCAPELDRRRLLVARDPGHPRRAVTCSSGCTTSPKASTAM